MPLIIALVVSLGSFLGYTTVQSHAADKALHNVERTLDNMYGAGAYLIRTYGISREESHDILGSWMRTFNEDDPAEKRARQTIMEGK